MKAIELRKMTVEQLREACVTTAREQFNFAMQKATGQTPPSHAIRALRRKVARIQTVLREKSEGHKA